VKPRPSANPAHAGKSFGSNAAAWWGFHYKELITEPKPREVITIYEIDSSGQRNWAQAVYNFRWTPQTDPFGVEHKTIDYPGVPVDHSTVQENHGVLKNVRIPIRPRRTSSTRSRPAISAATWIIGASAKAPPCTIRSRFPAPCSRSATRMLRRAIPKCAAPPSSAR
jgi:hypothetical protein